MEAFQTFQTVFGEARYGRKTYKRLRQILEKQNGHVYTIEEAKEIGDELIDFFNALIDIYDDQDNV